LGLEFCAAFNFCAKCSANWFATQRQVIHRLDFRRWRGQNGFMADENSRRTEKIESNLAHLEHQVEQLNGVVIEQGKLLERLKKEVQRQSRAMESLELERIKGNNAKPPHYQ
jgi:SlyX protein